MRIGVYAPLALSLLLAAVGAQVGRRVAPALAARALTGAAVLTAAATTWALILLTANPIKPVTAEAREEGRALPEPVPEVIALAAALALGAIAYRLHLAIRAERAIRRPLARTAHLRS